MLFIVEDIDKIMRMKSNVLFVHEEPFSVCEEGWLPNN